MRSRGASPSITIFVHPFPSDLVVNDVSQARLNSFSCAVGLMLSVSAIFERTFAPKKERS
jgi:hypothetical protein